MSKYVIYSYPAVKWGVVFSTGIVVAYTTSFSLTLWAIVALSLIVGYIISGKITSRFTKFRVRSGLSLLLLMTTGALLFASQTLRNSQLNNVAQTVGDSADEVTAMISIQESKSGREGYRYIGIIDSVISPAGFKPDKEIKLYLIHQSDTLQLLPGRKVSMSYRAFEMPSATNPYQFDFSGWLESQNVFLSAIITKIDDDDISIEKNTIAYWRNVADERLRQVTSAQSYPIAKALVMGNKSELSFDEKRNFSRSGMAHLMAVSGLHVGFVVAPFLLLLPMCRYKPARRIAFLLLMLVMLTCYAALTGFSASVLRSSFMVLLFVGGTLWMRQINAVNVTAFSALVLLFWNPSFLFDVGFQLSYTAVFVILLLFPPVDSWLKERVDSTILRWIASSALLAIVVQIGLYPLLSYHFFEFSVVSPITNIFALFPTAIIVGGGLIGVLLGGSIPLLDRMIIIFLDNLTAFLQWMSEFMSHDFAYIHSSRPGLLFFVFWAMLIWVVIARDSKVWRVRSWIASLSLIFLLSVTAVTKDISKSLEIIFFDVGQGDAAIVHTPNNHHILIDTGVWSPTFDSGSSILLPYLKARGISKLDAIILTHPHADHIGGTEAIIDAIQIDSVFLSNQSYESQLHDRIQFQLDSMAIPHRFLEAGNLLIYSDLNIFTLWPPSIFDDNNVNNESIVFMMNYGNERFLFTGDIESETEELITNLYGPMLKSDLLKVGHHGSKSSTSESFLNKIDPEIAVVSNGYRNRYRHPHSETTNRLLSHNTNVYFTALNGAIYVRSNGDTTRVIPFDF
jgi:competence protein ComEC